MAATGKIAAARRRTYTLLERGCPKDKLSRGVDIALIVLISTNVFAIILESVVHLRIQYWTFFYGFEVFCVAIFTIEYLGRLWACIEREEVAAVNAWVSRLRYAVSPVALCDLVAIVPFYLSLLVAIDLRFLRVLRLLRIFKLTRYSSALNLMFSVFKEESRSFGATLFVLLVVMIFAASGIYWVERQAQPEAFGSIPAAMWWAVATLTTVGYGDVTPITPLGKFFGACITIIGIGMVALPSGLLASGFSEQLRRRRQRYEQQVDDALEDGVITADDQQKLDRLREDLGFTEEEAAELLNEAARRGYSKWLSHCPHCGEPLDRPFEHRDERKKPPIA